MSRHLQFLQYGDHLYATNMSWVGASECDEEDIVDKVCPELKKLDKLDAQEFAIRKKMMKGQLDQNVYSSLVAVIQAKRDKLTKKLEKEGYFSEDEAQEQLDIENPCVVNTTLEEKWASMSSGARVVIGIVAFVLLCVALEMPDILNTLIN